MGDRQGSLNVYFSNLGSGSVNRLLPDDLLAVPNSVDPRAQTGLINNPDTAASENVRLFEGIARRRNGYVELGTALAALPITGVYAANFGQGVSQLIATAAGGKIYKYQEGAATWVDISGGVTFNALTTQPFTFTMAPKPGAAVANFAVISSPGDDIYKWEGTGNISLLNSSYAPKKPHFLINFLSRLFCFNVVSPDTGDRYQSRLQYSTVGDSTDFLSLGAGFTDLEDDPYPLNAGATIGGRMLLLKGDYHGGAMYIASPTGSAISPLRYDGLNPDSGVGILVPKSLIPLSPATRAFFLGHDSAYLYNGGAEVVPFATKVTRDIISRITYGAEQRGWAVYNRHTQEITLAVPTDGSILPSEVWIFNIATQQASGPMTYFDTMMSGAVGGWTGENNLTWNTWGQADPGPFAPRQWDTLDNDLGAPYGQWDQAGDSSGIAGTYGHVFGGNDGKVYNSLSTHTNDDGEQINCIYYCPAMTPKDWLVAKTPGSRPEPLRSDDVLVLRRVVVRSRADAALASRIPVVEVSTNGGAAWTKISDDTAVNPGNQIKGLTYYCEVPGVWHQVRVKNTAGDGFGLQGVELEFTYAGSERHE